MKKSKTSRTTRGGNPSAAGPARGGVEDRYWELIREFPLRPIRSDAELDRAIVIIDSLIDQNELTLEEDDYLDVLGDLVEKYETEHHPMPTVSDADMLRYLIESRETTQTKVSEATGIAPPTLSEILAGKRGLNRRHIELLARHFKVSPAVFLSS